MAWEQLAPQVIARLSKDLQLTPAQAAGIVGQLGYESDGLQAINERNPTVPGSRGGFGWAQWTGPRRQQFESFAAGQKMDVTDPEANYQFLLHELRDTPESRVLDGVRKAQDAQTAGRVFTDQFLRPGVPAYDKRQSWTEQALNFIMPAARAGTLPKQDESIRARIDRAHAAGFDDNEILKRIQANADMSARIQKARDAGFTDEEIFGRMGLKAGQQPDLLAEPPQRSFAERAGAAIMEIPRQVGLTARYGLEGLGQAAGIVTEPIRQGLNVGLRAAGLPEAANTAQVASSAADTLGLPGPQTANERVVGDATRLMAGVAGVAGTANALARGAAGVTQSALQALGANPGSQVASAASAGAAGGAVREAGGSPLAQAGAALAGGLVAPMAVSSAQSAVRGIQSRFSDIDQRIRQTLAQAGTNFDDLPARVQQQMRIEVSQALRQGDELSPGALRRLADFQRIEGATPTRGMLTQDPGQITREQNLAKIQANSTVAGGRNLSQIQNENNVSLVRALDQAGASDDAMTAGHRAIESLQRRLGGQQARINDLYSLARDSAGRSFPLDGRAFADRAIQALDDQLVGGALPADVRNHLNRISAGEVPFTVDYAEQLKTLMGRLQRGTSDGSARYALGLVRQALDDAPVLPLGQQTTTAGARAVNPGNLPATTGSEIGEQAVEAFNRARSANRAMMRQVESTPALKALYEGTVAPDNFLQKYIISSSVPARNVNRLARLLAADPPARDSVRGALVQHLKDRALSGMPDDIGAARFSAANYTKALKQLGRNKLAAFFEPQEIEQLEAISRVGRLMSNQPVGSAVNNSNSATTFVGRAFDALGTVGRGLRILGIGDQIGAIQGGLQQRAAQRVSPALLDRVTTPSNRLLQLSTTGSLLAAPGMPGSE
ncbi:phage tail tip lysozyme [Castellaniella sp. S9]|uniref:phage tail tip lysozyme n=1 Tax=Castellaniella sp. S9 TaxID=2993652 RepID=UPI0022B4DC2A|nr:phage tail tip lysozyme [Castellaniella sp. S9]